MPTPYPTWETAVQRYLDWRKKHDLQKHTLAVERRHLVAFRAAFATTSRPHELTEEMVLEVFLRMKTERGLATQTRSHYATSLRQFLEYHAEPAARWIPSFPDPGPSDVGRYLTAEERSRLWSACRSPAHEFILAMGLGQGARKSDVLKCRLLDFAPSLEDPQFLTFHGKGEKWKPVTVRVHPKLRETLVDRYLPWRTAQLAHMSAIFQWEPVDPPTLLIAQHCGNRAKKRPGRAGSMGPNTFDDRLAEIYDRSGVDPGGAPSHNFRRTWAENRLEAVIADFNGRGENPTMALELALRVVAKEGRWKSVETLRRYLKRQMEASPMSLAKTLV